MLLDKNPAELHAPVLRDRCVELLAPALSEAGSVFVDGTLGMGGHSEAVLEACPNAKLVAFDRDRDAIALAARRLERFGDRVNLIHAVYDELDEQLDQILQQATPAARRDAGHPAKRVFQALRIAVNGELEALESAIPQALDRLAIGGRIVIESYQSLEDRFVKRELQRRSTSSAPRELPMELPEHQPEFALLVRGAERASDEEAERNPRAIPVRLRAAERIRRHA